MSPAHIVSIVKIQKKWYNIYIRENKNLKKRGYTMFTISAIIGFLTLIVLSIATTKKDTTEVIDETIFEIDN